MINTSVSKNEHTIQSGVVEYPIGFPFYFNPDRTPQLRVKIGDEELRFNHNFELSEDKGSVVLRPTEEDSWTLEGPEDFSWMAKWDGKDLLIERVVPFVQDSDYQLGRISSEQIERDFDLSVMRDQALYGKIKKLRGDMVNEFVATDSRIDFVQEQTDARFAETDNAISELSSGVTANEAAIREVRDDFASADQAIRADMNEKDAELEHMIAERAEELITLRSDVNEADSKLQNKITEQAAEIATKQDKLTAGDNIIISNNVISATGAGGGAVLDFIVVQELPETGQKGVVYLLAKDGAAPDVYDEYVWITTTQTFELIGSTKVDLTDYAKKEELDDYLPLSGGTLTGPIKTDSSMNDSVFIQTSRSSIMLTSLGQIYFSGKIGFNTNIESFSSGNNIGTADAGFGTAYLRRLNNGTDIAIPTTGGTMALAENVETAISDAVANIDALPDQTGNAGKVLMTDGDKASWQDAPAGGTKVIIKRYE